MAINIIHPETVSSDERGSMSLLVNVEENPIKSVLRIICNKGAIRGNHYHKVGIHYYYVESGKVEYFEKPANSEKAEIESVVLVPGDMVIVGPEIINSTRALEESVIYHFDISKRDPKSYEENTVRVKII